MASTSFEYLMNMSLDKLSRAAVAFRERNADLSKAAILSLISARGMLDTVIEELEEAFEDSDDYSKQLRAALQAIKKVIHIYFERSESPYDLEALAEKAIEGIKEIEKNRNQPQNSGNSAITYATLSTFKAGAKTCASTSGESCKFLGLNLKGNAWCSLFGDKLWEEDGWVQRSPECRKKALTTDIESLYPRKAPMD